MDRLEDLARRELAVLARAEGTRGDMSDADRRLREAGVYAEAAAIHAAYVELAAPPESSLEALKRAVFLAWYAQAEPPCLTGVGDLDERAVRRTHELLADAHEAGRIDEELAAMLGYYRGVTDWHFTTGPSAQRLGFVAALAEYGRERPHAGLAEADHRSRGQMGRYWAALAGRPAGRALRPKAEPAPERGATPGGPGHGERAMRVTIFHIKAVHTAIFFILSACVLFVLYSSVSGRISGWTWTAVALVAIESVVLASCGWTCPLTILAERLGAKRGAVTDIFLPKWFADRIFPICGTTFLVACIVLVVRLVAR